MDWANGRLLRNRAFRTVAGGEVLSMLSDYAYQVPFGWIVLTVTGSALVWRSYAMMAAFGLADAFFCPHAAHRAAPGAAGDLPAANALLAREEQAVAHRRGQHHQRPVLRDRGLLRRG